MLDFNQIAVFVTVVEAGSFTDAARQLDMPKSTVSRRVSDLEAQLGVTLMRRTTRRLTLTDVGAAFYETSRRAVSEARLAVQAVHDAGAVPRGTLRVTAPPGVSFLADLVARFMCRYPGVSAELDFSQRHVDLIAEGYDVALRPGPLPDLTSLKVRRLGSMTAWLVAAPRYVEQHGAPDTLADLAHHECIRFQSTQGVMPWRFEVDGEVVVVEVQGRLATNDFDAVSAAARAGVGIAMLPSPSAAADVEEGHLVRLLPGVQTTEQHISAVFPAARYLAPRIRAFLDFLTEEFSPGGDWMRRLSAGDRRSA